MKTARRIVLTFVRIKFRLLGLVSPRKAAENAFALFCTPQYRNLKQLPRVFEEAEKLITGFKNYSLSGYRWNKNAAKRVMIIHGFESSVINYDSYIQPLIKEGYEVLAFDAPAHGRSSGKRINTLLFKEFIQFITGRYGPVDSFMAHSFGALALVLALEEMAHDDRTKIVLVAPLTETTSTMNLFFDFIRLDKPVREAFSKIIQGIEGHPPDWYSIRRAMHHINARVLWLHDEDDTFTPLEDARKVMADHHPQIEFVISKGLGHRKIYRDEIVRRKIVQFFSDNKEMKLPEV